MKKIVFVNNLIDLSFFNSILNVVNKILLTELYVSIFLITHILQQGIFKLVFMVI